MDLWSPVFISTEYTIQLPTPGSTKMHIGAFLMESTGAFVATLSAPYNIKPDNVQVTQYNLMYDIVPFDTWQVLYILGWTRPIIAISCDKSAGKDIVGP